MAESRSFSKPIRLTASRNNFPTAAIPRIRNRSCSILLKIYGITREREFITRRINDTDQMKDGKVSSSRTKQIKNYL